MGNMKEIGLLDCEDRPSVEENFKRVRGAILDSRDAVLDSNGKLLNEVLPVGYPYIATEEKSVECPSMEDDGGLPFILEGFPTFSVGDTVKVKVDGVEYSLVAFDDDGYVTIGDSYTDFEAGTGKYGWQIYLDRRVVMASLKSCTVSFLDETVYKLDSKFIDRTIDMENNYLPGIVSAYDIVDIVRGKQITLKVGTTTYGELSVFRDSCVLHLIRWNNIDYKCLIFSVYGRGDGSGDFTGILYVLAIDSNGNVCKIHATFDGNDNDSVINAVTVEYPKSMILNSSTEGSAKQFAITVDDSGTLTATEVTE